MASHSITDNHGLVRPWERDRAFQLETLAPSPQLQRLIDRHWIVRWDRRDREPFQQEILPHPSVNLVIEPDGAWIWGVPTQRVIRILRDKGWAVGAKLKPGVFTALTGINAAGITNGRISTETALGHDLHHAASDGDLRTIIASAEAVLASHADLTDPSADLVGAVIENMRNLAPDARVQQIAAAHHLAPRTLQRLFQRYVGVGPKWVLKRLRIHYAIERLTTTSPPAWTELALELGYYDHAHFVRDFRLVVGCSPTQYLAQARAI